MNPRNSNTPRTSRRRSIWPVIYAVYLSLILFSVYAFYAENPIDDIRNNMDEKYTYSLTFPTNGELTHYDVMLHNNSTPGKITLTYWTQDNKLDLLKVENIKSLEIDVESLFTDESMKIFKKSSLDEPNLYLDYWLDAADGIFTIEFDINKTMPLENLTLTRFPTPKSVLVNNQEWWKTGTNYVKLGNEITISNIPTGKTRVLMYFKEPNKLPIASFTTTPTSYAGVNENITFNGSSSYDPEGSISSWVWKFGDGNSDSGQTVVHNYSTPGNYTIRLTVRDNAVPFGESWTEKTITISFGTEDDFDSDGLRDAWEWTHFGSLTETGTGDPDGDNATNKQEHDAGTDPKNASDYPYVPPKPTGKITLHVVPDEVAEGSLSDDSGDTLIKVKASGNGTLEVKSASEKIITQLEEDEPEGKALVGAFLEITLDDLDWIYIEVPYNESDLPAGVSEESLRLYYYNETLEEWVECENSSVDTVKNIVKANVTHLTVFAAMGKETAKKEEPGQEPEVMDFMGIIIILLIVIVLVVVIMMVIRKKRTKEKVQAEAEAEAEAQEAIAEWEEQIAHARGLGLPTGELQMLLKAAKEGNPIEVKPETERRGKAKVEAKGRTKGKRTGRTKGKATGRAKGKKKGRKKR